MGPSQKEANPPTQTDIGKAGVSKKVGANNNNNHDNCPDCLSESKTNIDKSQPRRKRSLDGEKGSEKSEENLKIKVDNLSDEKVYFKSFQILKNLGEGSFGKVYLVTYKMLNIENSHLLPLA